MHYTSVLQARFCRSFIRYLGRLDPGYSQHLGLATIELTRVQIEIAQRRAGSGELDRQDCSTGRAGSRYQADSPTCDAVLHRTALVAAMRENLALQSQASRWIQVVKVDGLL